MHRSLCICPLLPAPRLETRTRLVLLIHREEDRKPTNTGRLAAECLANSEVVVRGRPSEPALPVTWSAASQPLLLFPHEGSVLLTELAPTARPVTLFVPDGTWRQASKVRSRVPGLLDVPCVSLPLGEPSSYRLRSEAHPTGLATLEAIARALGILEGAEVRGALEHVFRVMVDRTLWLRGELEAAAVRGGIPEAAILHDPRGGLPATARNLEGGRR